MKIWLKTIKDVRLYNDDKELEIKEEIEDAIDFNIEDQKKMISGESQDVVLDNELSEGYIEGDSEELETFEDDEENYEDEELFAGIEDVNDDDFMFDNNDLSENNDFDIDE